MGSLLRRNGAQRQFGHDDCQAVQQTMDGGYIIGGIGDSDISGNKMVPSFGSSDYWIIKLDRDGNRQWEQVFGGTGGDNLAGLEQTPDGGFILEGYSNSGVSGNKTTPNYGSVDYWLLKVRILPQFSFASAPSANFEAQLTGIPGTNYAFEQSTDLIHWTGISTNSSTNGVINFSDQRTDPFSHKFYRARQVP